MAAPSDPEDVAGREPSEEGPAEAGAEVSIRRIEILNVSMVVAAALAVLALWTREVALAVVAGGFLSAASFRVIAAVMKAVFAKGSTSFWPVATFWIKYALMMSVVGVLILVYRVDVMGLLIGLSLILPSIVVEAAIKLASKE